MIPPPSSDGLMQVLRGVPSDPCSIAGSFMTVGAVQGLAASVKHEADSIAALTAAMISEYQATFHGTVLKLLSLVQSQPLVFGFARDYSFTALRATSEKLCPKCAIPIMCCTQMLVSS